MFTCAAPISTSQESNCVTIPGLGSAFGRMCGRACVLHNLLLHNLLLRNEGTEDYEAAAQVPQDGNDEEAEVNVLFFSFFFQCIFLTDLYMLICMHFQITGPKYIVDNYLDFIVFIFGQNICS